MTTFISVLLISSLVALIAVAATGIAVLMLGTGREAAVVATTAGPSSFASGGSFSLLRRVARLGLGAAFALLLGALLVRTLLVGHAPWANLHEFSLAFAAALVGAHLLLARTHLMDGLAPLTALLAAGLVGFALSLDDRVDPLVPALQQPLLLTVHVGCAAIAYAVSGIAFLAAVAEIGQARTGDRIPLLPSALAARSVGHRAVLIAFPILTAAIVLGSVWANLAWRSYWSNDPKELAAAATWLVFGGYLHVAGRRDRWERGAPWLIVLGFVGVLFTYLGAGLFFIGEHSYAAP
jgi:ABC-type transport system involved in cytochrome c biogenesis permease subunit